MNNTDYYSSFKQNKKQKKRRWSAWQEEEKEVVPLCKGVEIADSVYDIEENRYYTLILKGLIVYFITAGGIGSYLTALNISFNQILFNFVILSKVYELYLNEYSFQNIKIKRTEKFPFLNYM